MTLASNKFAVSPESHTVQAPPVRTSGPGGICGALILAVLALAPRLTADDAAARSVTVIDAEGKSRSGHVTELSAGNLTLGHIEQARLKTKNLVLLKVKDRALTIAPADPLVFLTGGDVLVLRPEMVDDETVTARWVRFPAWPAVKLPLEAVRGLLLSRPAGAAAATRLLNQIAGHRDPQDVVLMANGDTVGGEFAGLDDKQLWLQSPSEKAAIDRAGIRAVMFNPTLTSQETLKGEGALVSLVDGSRFRARELKFGPLDRLTLRTVFGAELELPLSAIESLRFLGGCATYLSDLAPSEYKFEPFLGLDWPLRNDAAVTGGPLALRGVQYPKGLGVHSRSTVTYRLDGKFRWFHAVIGIDDDTSGKGSAAFEVLVDGKTAYKSDVLTGTSAPVAIERLSVAGAKLLTLRVDYATLGDIQDHADWCDALLVK